MDKDGLAWKKTAYYLFWMLMTMCFIALSEAVFIWITRCSNIA